MCEAKGFTKEAAIAALSIIQSRRNNRKTDKRPRRRYYCNDCNQWHLSSKTKKEFYQFNKQQKNSK